MARRVARSVGPAGQEDLDSREEEEMGRGKVPTELLGAKALARQSNGLRKSGAAKWGDVEGGSAVVEREREEQEEEGGGGRDGEKEAGSERKPSREQGRLGSSCSESAACAPLNEIHGVRGCTLCCGSSAAQGL